jgi:hypothetical protein
MVKATGVARFQYLGRSGCLHQHRRLFEVLTMFSECWWSASPRFEARHATKVL